MQKWLKKTQKMHLNCYFIAWTLKKNFKDATVVYYFSLFMYVWCDKINKI